MKFYFSHYIFIYPDIYLKKCIIQLNLTGEITNIISFEKEIPNTKFYSGLLMLIPKSSTIDILSKTKEINDLVLSNNVVYSELYDLDINKESEYYVYHNNQII